MDARTLEMKSSAMTLSDMEMFVFPQLLYGLVLANIMSPSLWKWRKDPWFAGIEKMPKNRRVNRLKQYIMDHYVFNLDLDTWGLTTKEKEIARFREFISPEVIAQSNALFGYEGDKYYFDIDIRTHFGLDRYNSNVIPYWKTETIEAMDAFKFKPGYVTGAGECVSLAALYASALFLICRIPLKDIYLMATPLHSQNYIDVGDGILTNNRRIVTKNMWFNGTELSAQARRALENEKVTLVVHESGWIHIIYDESTISPEVYRNFSSKLRNYLKTDLTAEIIGNFIRHSRNMQKCFQFRCLMNNKEMYLPAEKAFAYEEECSFKVTDSTRDKLLAQIDTEEFSIQPLKGRIVINDLESYIKDNKPDINNSADMIRLKEKFVCDCLNAEIAIENLIRFCKLEPRLPDHESKKFISAGTPLNIDVTMEREEIFSRLKNIRNENEFADLFFYAYRDINMIEWQAFVKAAIERSPVSLADTAERDIQSISIQVESMPNESIYEGDGRLAQPDEVWNYKRGDGIEKALLLANIIKSRYPNDEIKIIIDGNYAVLKSKYLNKQFVSFKNVKPQEWDI